MQQESEQRKSKYNLSEIFNDLTVELFTIVSNATKSAIEYSQYQPNSTEIRQELLGALLETFPSPSNNEVSGVKKSENSEIMSNFIRNEFAGFRNEIKQMIDQVNKEFLTRNNNFDSKSEKIMIKELAKRFEAIINKKSEYPKNASFFEKQLYKNFNEFKKNFRGRATTLYNPTSPINDLYQRTLVEMSKTRDTLLPAERAEGFVTSHYSSNTIRAIQEYLHNLAKEFEQDNHSPLTLAQTTDNINATFAAHFKALNSIDENDPKKQIAVDLVKHARQAATSIASTHYTKTHPTPKAESRRGSGIFSNPSSRRGSGIFSSPSSTGKHSVIPSAFRKGMAELKEAKEKEQAANTEKGPSTTPSMQNSNN